MSTRFDPYHKWLGIPPAEQPPNLYRLLGLRTFESDPDVISNAADQRMGLLKTFATSQNSAFAEDLLNEVARARVCLLNSAKKLAYDRALQDTLNVVSSEAQIQEGFWIPSLHGVSETLEMTCLRCDESATYDVTPFAQVISCKRCHRQMRVPSREDVAQAAALLTQKSTQLVEPSNARSPNESTKSPKTNEIRQEFAHQQSGNTKAAPESATKIDPLLVLPASELVVLSHRRKKPRQRFVAAFFTIILGSIVGLPAGYFVLCVIDMRYDFLNLIKVDNASVEREASHIGSAKAPRRVPFGNTERQPRPRAPQTRPNDRVKPPINTPSTDRSPWEDFADDPQLPPNQNLPDPFANIPPYLPLPTPHAINKQTTLIPVPLGQLDNFELMIIGHANRRDGQANLRRLRQDEATWTWAVDWISDVTSEIATFSIIDDELQFSWSNEPDRLGVVALRNAILKIRANQRDYFVALRAPTVMQSLTFDLNNTVDLVLCDCDDLPDVNEMRVDILDLENCPRYQQEGAGLLGMKLNDETILRYSGVADAATKITFANYKDRLAIEVENRYRLPAGTEDTMNIRRGNRKLINLRKAFAIRKTDALRTDLASLERIAELASKLHGNVVMSYRFYLVVERHEIELATTQR